MVRKRRRRMQKQRTLKELLDSDDELSGDYTESHFVPAYQDNSRFDHILNNIDTKPETGSQTMHRKGTTNAVRTAWLTRKDTYCYHFVDKKMPRHTSIWFFQYLLFKDVQSKYKFLKSCLVPRYFN